MDDFVHALAAYGVAPFTVLLIAAILYWLLVILGALDLDLLHLGHHHDGAVGHGDGHDHHPGAFAGLLEFLSIGKVPLTVVISILVFSGWSVAMAAELLLPLPWPVDLAGALAVAVPFTGVVCRPLRALFHALDGGVATGVSLIGREARITSVTCDQTFGTAACAVAGSDELLLRVVASRPELVFRRDEVVVIADHDAERDVYTVGPAAYRNPAPALATADPLPVEPLTEQPAQPVRARPTITN